MAATFYIKQNDTAPSIEAVLTDSNDRARSLATASAVRFHMKRENGAVVISAGTGSIVNPGKGIVKYEWQSGDTKNVGTHTAEFEVEYSNGQIETFPNSSYIKVIVKGELA
jgi:hypothetical protein